MLPGIFTSNSGINGERMDSFSNRIYRSGFGGTAPMLALSSGMRREVLKSKIVHWFEEEEYSGRVEIVNNAATGTTITLASGQTVVEKTILMVETTGEQMLVTAVNGQSLTVIRGFANTSTTTIDGSTTAVGAYVLGNSFEEASLAPAPMMLVGAPLMNYSQIFRHSFANSRSASRINWHTGDKVAKNKQDCIANHARDIERALLFGQRSMFTLDGVQASTLGGLTSFIKTNVEACDSGGLTYRALVDFIGELYRYNVDGQPQERIAWTGNNVISVIQQLVQKNSHLNIQVGQNEFGIKVNKIITPFGDLSLLTHPMFNASPVWQNNILAFHPGAVVLQYMDDAVLVDSTPPGMDGEKWTVTSELTMEYHCEKTAGLMTGITKAAAAG